MRRVAVTGLGAVTPLGLDARSTWRTAIAGESGIDWIQAFDASELPVRIAAEVKDFDPGDFMDRKAAKRMERFAQFSIAAAGQALSDASFSVNESNAWDVGAVVATR